MRRVQLLMLELSRRRRQRGSVKRRHRLCVRYIFEEQQRLQHSQYQIILQELALCDQELYYRYIWQVIPLRYSLIHTVLRIIVIATIVLGWHFHILASNSSKRITGTKMLSVDRKQSETVYDCVSISFPRFCIATRRQQYNRTISISCVLFAIIGDYRRWTWKVFPFMQTVCDQALGRCLRLFATELRAYGNSGREVRHDFTRD